MQLHFQNAKWNSLSSAVLLALQMPRLPAAGDWFTAAAPATGFDR
jgi:hypothetical protein